MSLLRPKSSAAALALALSQQTDKEEPGLKHLSDDVITNRIFDFMTDEEMTKIDLDNYVLFIENVLKASDQICVASHWVRFTCLLIDLEFFSCHSMQSTFNGAFSSTTSNASE